MSRLSVLILLSLEALLTCAVVSAGSSKDPFGAILAGRRERLKARLALYVKYNRAREWTKLYDLVSDTGRGGVSRQAFVTAMKEAHGTDYAGYPDLLDFLPDHATAREDGGYDIYGCAKARREEILYSGIAVAHAVFEHNNWFFTGWAFADVPMEPCRDLAKPSWRPETHLDWDEPMEELRKPPGPPPPAPPHSYTLQQNSM